MTSRTPFPGILLFTGNSCQIFRNQRDIEPFLASYYSLEIISSTIDERIPLPPSILRQILAEILPYHLESRIGPDGDGLYVYPLLLREVEERFMVVSIHNVVVLAFINQKQIETYTYNCIAH